MAAKPLAFLTRIGPIEFRGQPPVGMYVAFDAEGQLLQTSLQSPPNDGAGLRELAKKLPGHDPRCGLELAEVGAQLGLELHELPPRIALERAATAYVTRAMPHTRVVAGPARELLAAGAEYLRGAPWKRITSMDRFPVRATVRSLEDGATYPLSLSAHVEPGNGADGPALSLEDDGDFARSFVEGEPAPMKVRVALAADPPWLADAVEEGLGLRFAPRIAYLMGGRLTRPHPSHALLLAAVLRATSRATGGAGEGHALDGGLEVEVSVDFAHPLPKLPPPTLDTALGRRARARFAARTLAATRPLPHFDDHVCLVLDPDDDLANSAYLRLGKLSPAPKKGAPAEYVRLEELVTRWLPAKDAARWFEADLGQAGTRWLRGALPHESLRVLLIARDTVEAFHVDRDPREAARLGKAIEDASYDELVARQLDWHTPGAPPKPIEGTWRDGMTYLPTPLPTAWTVGTRSKELGVPVTVGTTTFHIGSTVRDGHRWVAVLFLPESEGREVHKDAAQALLRHLVGVGRFIEMEAYFDAREASRIGSRIFHAVVAKARPMSKVPKRRSRDKLAALIEHVKPFMAELLVRARDEKRPVSDFCVVATPGPNGHLEGIVLSREDIEEAFDDPRADLFDLRGRFEEPRPKEECLVLVKHPDGVEEIHASLEDVTMIPIANA